MLAGSRNDPVSTWEEAAKEGSGLLPVSAALLLLVVVARRPQVGHGGATIAFLMRPERSGDRDGEEWVPGGGRRVHRDLQGDGDNNSPTRLPGTPRPV